MATTVYETEIGDAASVVKEKGVGEAFFSVGFGDAKLCCCASGIKRLFFEMK